jgi:hypothetical protein
METRPYLYPSPRLAMQAPAERLAYVAMFNPKKDGRPDAMTVVDLAPDSSDYGQIVGRVDMPKSGDELHHFGWNACSSALCPYAPHPHIERRYLVVPGLRSSRIHILDTKPNPRQPEIVRVIEPEEVSARVNSGLDDCPDGERCDDTADLKAESTKRSGKYFVDHFAVHVSKPEVPALELEGQLLVVDPKTMQNSGLQVMHVHRVRHDVV